MDVTSDIAAIKYQLHNNQLQSYQCDGVEDCADGSDEKQEVCGNVTMRCRDGMFTCADGDCTVMAWKCDHFWDCKDGSDEEDCDCKL